MIHCTGAFDCRDATQPMKAAYAVLLPSAHGAYRAIYAQ
jgi:hypothetical protein